MTKTELYAAWERWMHRNDISGDLDTIWAFASQMVTERLMSSTADDAETILSTAPRMFQHAGLIYLHELAQDDQGGPRESELFNAAVQDYMIKASVDAGQARMAYEKGIV